MEKLNQLLSVQEDRLEQIQKSHTNYLKSPKSRISIAYLDARLENLEKIWSSFDVSHNQLLAHIPRDQRTTLKYFMEDIYEKCEEIYMLYKGEIKTKSQEIALKLTAPGSNQSKSTTSEIKLPTINIPVFSGKYTDWPSFHDLFDSIIHKNNSLESVQKLHYLKSSLAGEAEHLLRSITITSSNYDLAWQTLNNRYNNKKYISNCIFKRLFSIKAAQMESALAIKHVLDITVECLSSLKNLGLPTHEWDAIVIYMTVSKLDSETHKLWEQHNSMIAEEFPKFEALKQFLETRFRSLEMIEQSAKSTRPKSFHAAVDSVHCAFCKEDHYIYQCKKFAKEDYKTRYDFVQNNNLCFNCLIPNHSANKCMRNTSCRVCKKRHHSLLHPDKRETVTGECHLNSSQNMVSHFIKQPGQVLLATALVDVANSQKETRVFRALIDQGSQASFVSEDLVQTLRLKRVPINGLVAGLSEGNTLQTKFMVEVCLKSRHNTNFTILVNAYVLKKITNYLPTQHFTLSNWPEIESIELADPTFHRPNKISLLLGADVYSQIIDNGLLKSSTGLIAQKTHLGWILSGDTSNTNKTNYEIVSLHVNEVDILRRFWEIENETFTEERKLTKEELECENIYKKTTKRLETGRYIVNLPFKHDVNSPFNKCGDTKQTAILRFYQLERHLKKNQELRKEYQKVLKDYQEQGHMTLINEPPEDSIYIPHFAVVHNDKITTKVRVVFDASVKGSNGISLNETMLVGPVIQNGLRALIQQWRQYRIAIVADITKMYRQVLLTEKHRRYQSIIWRDDAEEELRVYQLNTVTFGTAAAPFLAVRTLSQLADDESHRYPLAANTLKTSFYVDDLMTGVHEEKEAFDTYENLNNLLTCGGFQLQKWSSNSCVFLDKINSSKSKVELHEITFDTIIKTLGLSWDRKEDTFKFHVKLGSIEDKITKRKVLSEIARLFDPFGWLSPSIVVAKIFMQKLWLCATGWDEDLPENLKKEWLAYRNNLKELEEIRIQRWIHTNRENTRVELHGFADASSLAYAAVVYLKVENTEGVYVTIIESKTKVAPLKQISIARLELCAAVLLTRLLGENAKVLKIPRANVYAYTDSMVVLAWIQAEPIRWQTFVANRVSEIQSNLDNDRWSHVRSEYNPADLASRGVDPAELKLKQLWWSGPEWLRHETQQIKTTIIPDTNLERRKQITKTFHYEVEDKPIWERFSNLQKMIRVLTYCRRFLDLKIKKEKREKTKTYLTSDEMRETLQACIKTNQELEFQEEIKDLSQKKRLKSNSKLISLNPYLDKHGVLRVGGRLQAAKLSTETKHPIILPHKSHLTQLIIRDAHLRLLHGGISNTMNYLSAKYWIIGVKALTKQCYRDCIICRRFKAHTTQPQMGSLPSVRVTPGRAFETTGVDFAGPIQMRASKGRGQKSFKGYIALFICLKTKAVHLEAVSDLTSQGFIASFRRFVSRRGRCSEMWSDNGLNFVGASKELTQMFHDSKSGIATEIAEMLANDGTTWHFIPPKAPNFGGIWEAGIKSMKTHLVKTIGDATLTFEEMSTLLCQIEACMNSRPLCPMNQHPDDIETLTPAHFLVGESLLVPPEKILDSPHISPLDRWRLIQRMTRMVWNRWSQEYLHTLQQRRKWFYKTAAPRIGDVVIIKDNDLPPAKWLLGRITDVHRGPDGEIRVVTLKCKLREIKRPLSKLVLLPNESQNTDTGDGLVGGE